jgi:hypothetical protein
VRWTLTGRFLIPSGYTIEEARHLAQRGIKDRLYLEHARF